MRRYRFIILLAVAVIMMPAGAQKRKAKAPVKKKAPLVEVVENTKFEEMLVATQQIIFIDSVVVDKPEFLNSYKLGTEVGLVTGYNQFFHADDQPYSIVYVNQLGNKCWFANSGRLYTADLLGSQWSEPTPLEGLGRFQRTNYPFMLSDGTTLYFAAISDEGLGGLDIYMSRYDSESGKFLLSENIGLPFNSDANDYMYAVDELNGIGYFATDRRQPDGKVCIYTFIPNQKRQTYSTDELDEDVIRSRAKIERIADTWGDGTARQEALERLRLADQKEPQTKAKGDFTFVISDDIVYNSLSDFRNADNRDRMEELNAMRKRYDEMAEEIEKTRIYYATKASNVEKRELKEALLDKERFFLQLECDMHQLEKDIRKAEMQLQ